MNWSFSLSQAFFSVSLFVFFFTAESGWRFQQHSSGRRGGGWGNVASSAGGTGGRGVREVLHVPDSAAQRHGETVSTGGYPAPCGGTVEMTLEVFFTCSAGGWATACAFLLLISGCCTVFVCVFVCTCSRGRRGYTGRCCCRWPLVVRGRCCGCFVPPSWRRGAYPFQLLPRLCSRVCVVRTLWGRQE